MTNQCIDSVRPSLMVFAALMALGAPGCNKSTAPAKAAAAKSAAAPKKAAVPAADDQAQPAAQPEDPNAALAAAYHAVRCVLSGHARPDDAVYKAHGFQSPSAFAEAFSKVATEDPGWAKKTIAASIARDCGQQ